jgi:hypothetical protein
MARKNKAQTFVEYAMLIGVLVAVMVGMRVYFTRSVQAKYRVAGDSFAAGEQFEPGVTVVENLDVANPLPGAVTVERGDPAKILAEKIADLRYELYEKPYEDLNIYELTEAERTMIGLSADSGSEDVFGLVGYRDVLRVRASEVDTLAEYLKTSLEAATPEGRSGTLTENIEQLRKSADNLRLQATDTHAEIVRKEAELAELERQLSALAGQ